MDDEELQAFLERPLAAVVSTVSPRGDPHGVPVWYRFAGGVFTIWSGPSRRWVRNLQRNPAVSLVIAEHGEPYSAVVVRGTADVGVDAPENAGEIRRIARRYLPEDEVDGYIAQWPDLRTVVRIEPRAIRSWGRGY